MIKKIFLILSGLTISIILVIGVYSIISHIFELVKINDKGTIGIATIKTKWRGKCGSGYGNSVKFTIIINGNNKEYESICNVPNSVSVGDKYKVKYLIEDPSKNLVLFDDKIE